jgi:hypothetical protein
LHIDFVSLRLLGSAPDGVAHGLVVSEGEGLMDKIAELRKLVLNDQEFRQLLKSKPQVALKKADIDPTPQNLALIKNVMDSIDNLYYAFEEKDNFIT